MDGAPFGTLLREFRLARGLTQESLAERAAMSVNGISALERGANQTPQRKTLELIVKALALDAERARALEHAAIRPSRPRFNTAFASIENFPRSLTPFFGRRETLALVTRLIAEQPLVTLIGPGGIGKTRLALKCAEEIMPQFADGATFVDLGALRDGKAVIWALAAHFGVKGSGDEAVLPGLLQALRAKNLLLVIDNCEHLVDAVASAVAALNQCCPRLRIVATSRQPLKVPGEQLFRVPPLDVDAAAALFVERAKRLTGSLMFSAADRMAIGRIVSRLDGIALAIELAAARMNVLTLEELERHLSERFNVLSGAMRATMDWSYELLNARERRLFGRLCIFAGSFSLDAAVAVCGGDGMGKWPVFETLASLVDKSLVNSSPEGGVQRYRFLETTRAYAAECLCDADEMAALRRRHAAYCADLADTAAATLNSTGSTAGWAHALEPDVENLRAALDFSLQRQSDIAAGVRILSSLQELWIVQGMAAEIERRAYDAVNIAHDLPETARAALWLTIARMRQELFVHPARALEAASRARELCESCGDRRGLALALRQQAAADMRLERYSRARGEFELSLEIYRELGDPRMASRGLGYLASLLQVQGEYREARSMLLDVLQTAQSAGDDRMIPTIAMNLAEAEFALGDFESAAQRARTNLRNDVLQKSCDMAATQEANLSVYLLALGRTEEARAMALASIEDANGSFIAVPLQHLAASVADADPASAAKILGYVEAAFERTAFARQYTEKFSYDYLIASLHSAMEAGALATYRRDGSTMSERQILRLPPAALNA